MRTLPELSSALPLAAVRGGPAIVLRIEGLAVLVAACVAYSMLGGTWGWFAALFLLPDLSMLGYLVNSKVGAAAYNAAHTTLAGLALAAMGLAVGSHAMLLGASIWVAHVGFDRALGYGLKYATAFGHTHLGEKARPAPQGLAVRPAVGSQPS